MIEIPNKPSLTKGKKRMHNPSYSRYIYASTLERESAAANQRVIEMKTNLLSFLAIAAA